MWYWYLLRIYVVLHVVLDITYFILFFTLFIEDTGVSRPDRDPLDRPTHPISTRVQPKPMLSLNSFRFPRPRPNTGGSSGGFSSPKPEPLDLTKVIYKSGEIMLKFEEIQWVLNHIWWDLARSGHSQQISAILVQISAILMQIWWVFTFLGDELHISAMILQLRQWFCSSATTWSPPEQTRSPLEPKTDLTDWRRRSISGHSFVHPTPTGRVQVGSKTDSAQLVDIPRRHSGFNKTNK